jgi:hypothetical protein
VRGASLASVVAISIAILSPSFLLGQQPEPSSAPAPVTSPASSGLRDRDPLLEGARRIGSELQEANFHFGNVYILSRLRLSDIGFSEQYYVPTGDHRGGLAFSVDAPLRLYYVPSKKVVFSAEVAPGYSWFNGNGQRDRQFNYTARGGVQFLFNHLFLDVYGSAANQLHSRVADINRLTTVETQEVGLAGEWKHSSRTSVLFSARVTNASHPFDQYQPEVPVETPLGPIDVPVPVDLLDRDERYGRAALLHKTFPLTSLTAAVEYAMSTFDFAAYKDSTYTYAAPGFLFDSGRTELRVEAGPAQLRFDDPLQRDFSGILGELNFEHRRRRTTFTVSAERDVDYSILQNNLYYIADRGGAAADYIATRRLTLRVGTSAERDHYDNPIEGRMRSDTTSFSTVGFRYALRRLQTGIDVGWYDRSSTFSTQEDSGIRWVLHLSFSP